ncbi:hypothetical protein [Clostridium kluyveri]|uniref:hypothetical protein n=1 Tax=Clostridium kluyveri TaxID=1534 RepID=UPI002246CF29|nr:hypothetical protein [Clostridium kluyveri]UZQ50254.1 hypothetical protein OP486_20315 [Clostridium kluyveri]
MEDGNIRTIKTLKDIELLKKKSHINREVLQGIDEQPIEDDKPESICIDRLKSMPNFSMDFLQVFELKKIKNTLEFNNCYNQEIVHFQEEPEYKENIFLKVIIH